MREVSVREASQNFSQVIAAAERGETVVVTKNGRPVAKITPQSEDRASDPEWRKSSAALEARIGWPSRDHHGGRQNTATTGHDPRRDRQQHPHLRRNRARF
jgi:prevent-host-death family protein